MKATGIVRRIDDLGRVVIPKEIRRTMRIREGEPLEIFVDREGEVILKKYSPIGELSELAQKYAEALAAKSGKAVFIMDRDVITAVSGVSHKQFIDRQISPEVEEAMEQRKTLIVEDKGVEAFCENSIEKDQEYSFVSSVLSPIIVEGDPIGVVTITASEGESIGEIEKKLADTAALFLSRQLEH
ncbi:MAG: stage V sporulation protein T [Halanaerobiaceae bacterium]